MLNHRQILHIHEAAIAAGLGSSRDTLLVGLDPSISAGLPPCSDPAAQLLSDLAALSALPPSSAGEAPVAVWLANAVALAGHRRGAEIFRGALAALRGSSGVWAAPGAPDPASSEHNFEPACRLIRTRLPHALAAIPCDPKPILMRAEVPADFCLGATHLDQWTYVCDWLARIIPSGFVFTLRIVDQMQTIAFSENLSRWAALFIEALAASDPGGGGWGEPDDGDGGGTLKVLKHFVENEAIRWDRLREVVERMAPGARLSNDAEEYVRTMAKSWSDIGLALTGSRPQARVSETVMVRDLVGHVVSN